jgi:hypothetical protein
MECSRFRVLGRQYFLGTVLLQWEWRGCLTNGLLLWGYIFMLNGITLMHLACENISGEVQLPGGHPVTVYKCFVCYTPTAGTWLNKISITEANYAVKKLGAIGLGLLSNHEGYYLGNATFKPFFQYVNSTGKQTVIFIHPNSPWEHFEGQLISADPSKLSLSFHR